MSTRYTAVRAHNSIGGATLSPEFCTKAEATKWIEANKISFAKRLFEGSTEQDTRTGAEMLADYSYSIDRRQWA